MAFRFNWPEFDAGFYDEAKSQLEAALNKGNKPKNIVDHITVKELHMGTKPPELEILEVGELTTDKFRGIFKLTYAGDAYIVLQTKVQANPMHAKQSTSQLARHTRPKILAADQPLVVPMLLRISDLRLRGIIVLVVSKTKGITLVFKNDPLESIVISSTFDSVTSVRNFLQREIEKQLRNLFQEDLPVMIHNLSLRHIQNQREKEEQEKKQQQQQRRLGLSSAMSDPGMIRPCLGINDDSIIHDDDIHSLPTALSLPSSAASSTPCTPIDNVSMYFNNMDLEAIAKQHNGCLPPQSIYGNGLIGTGSLYSSNCSSACSSFEDDMRSYSSQASFSDIMPMYRPTTPPAIYTQYASIQAMHQYLQNCVEDDSVSLDSLNLSSTISSPSATVCGSVISSTSVADIYAEDGDAPWYVVEGPEIPSLAGPTAEQQIPIMFDQEIILRPTKNTLTARLAQLTCANRTLSPLPPVIQHSVCRSFPHAVKAKPMNRRGRKVPKRRIIRLSLRNNDNVN
ncbi:hypothetical protein BDC45DRAFT_532686 [Circinella umbellata]|nr:hypothetical protein BDC45DRAFT_532686 [Circinella umbellata]